MVIQRVECWVILYEHTASRTYLVDPRHKSQATERSSFTVSKCFQKKSLQYITYKWEKLTKPVMMTLIATHDSITWKMEKKENTRRVVECNWKYDKLRTCENDEEITWTMMIMMTYMCTNLVCCMWIGISWLQLNCDYRNVIYLPCTYNIEDDRNTFGQKETEENVVAVVEGSMFLSAQDYMKLFQKSSTSLENDIDLYIKFWSIGPRVSLSIITL